MPTKKAAFKHLKQTKVHTAKNRSVKEKVRATVKATRKAILAKDKSKAVESLKKTVKILDKAEQNKVYKKNTTSRLKSRMTKQINALT